MVTAYSIRGARMVRRLAAVSLAALLLTAFAGCSSDGDSPAAVNASTTSTTSPAPRIAKGSLYVALGSSIASGFGISEQSGTCGRSSRDYPQLVAAELGLKLVDVTCGAAAIPHVVDTPQGDNPVQLDAVSADTELITISVGGNDIAYNGTALSCGNPATECTAPADLEAKVAALPGQLRSMVEKVEAKAPKATIVFVTYPREIPATNCPALSLTDTERQTLQQMGQKLEDAFVDTFAKSDVVFVDPYVQPGDHTGCAADAQRWTAGYTVAKGEGFAFHPTALGHREMADEVVEALGG
jgi:lysophospholipase L1-like esterase